MDSIRILSSIGEYQKTGYGIEDDILTEIISYEGLLEITEKYNSDIDYILSNLNSKSKIRIIIFDDDSGKDEHSRLIFTQLKDLGRQVFYWALVSNKDTGVIFIHKQREKDILDKPHLLRHEFAHHYEITEADFPYYAPRNSDISNRPLFVNLNLIGAEVKTWYLDRKIIPGIQPDIPYRDSLERFSDVIVEKILSENNLSEDSEDFILNVNKLRDPTKIGHSFAQKRYIRRLCLRDAAEITASLSIHNPDKNYKRITSKSKNFYVRLNDKYLSRKKLNKMFEEIYNNTISLKLTEYKDPNIFNTLIEHYFDILKLKGIP